MEEFFKIPILEKLYEFQRNRFENVLIKDEKENTKYHALQDKENELNYEITKIVNNKEIIDLIKKLEIYFQQKNEYWNKQYYKLGITNGIELKKQIEEHKNLFEQIKKYNNETKNNNFSGIVHNFLDKIRERKN